MLATPALWAASMSVKESPTRAVAAGLASRDRHSLSGGIRLVVARTSHNPALLKPSPTEDGFVDQVTVGTATTSRSAISASTRAAISSLTVAE